MDRPLLVHLHMFKNAGSTVDGALRSCFGEGLHHYDGKRAWHRIEADELRAVVAERPTMSALSSHQLRLPLPAVSGIDLRPMVFLRDPLDRARSVWSFEKRQQADSPGARKAKELSVADYVRWRLGQAEISVISDFQIGVLGRNGAAADVEIDLAVERLAACEVVGVVERMTESMLAAEHGLARSFPGIDLSFVSRNVSPTGTATIQQRADEFSDVLGPTLAAELRMRNARDAELWRLANRELDRRLEAIPDLDGALIDFEARCAKLRPSDRMKGSE